MMTIADMSLITAEVKGDETDIVNGKLDQIADTDKTWRAAREGFMRMEKITYRSKIGDLDIPAFVFQPLHQRGPQGHPAIVWVHENIRGHLYEHYIPYID